VPSTFPGKRGGHGAPGRSWLTGLHVTGVLWVWEDKRVWNQCGSRVDPQWIQGGTTRQAAETQNMRQPGTLEEAEEA